MILCGLLSEGKSKHRLRRTPVKEGNQGPVKYIF